jgi:hypothetical protein
MKNTSKPQNQEHSSEPAGHSHPREILPGKKFTDFIFEFILLFLAITGGFFANNLRENIIDRNKEKEYMVSMIRDIEEDTALIGELLTIDSLQTRGLDTLLNMMDSSDLKIDVVFFYDYNFKYLHAYYGFNSRDITISQLRNSGGLRLIDDKAALDSIVLYYSEVESHIDQRNYNASAFQEIIELEIRYLKLGVTLEDIDKLSLPDPSVMQEFYNRILVMKSLIEADRSWMESVYRKGGSLIAFLKNKYRLEKRLQVLHQAKDQKDQNEQI